MGKFVAAIVVIVVAIWAGAALWIDGSPVATFVFAAVVVAVLIWIRPLLRGMRAVAGCCVVVIVWWLSLDPSNERQWLPDVAHQTTASIDGDRVVIQNVRNFRYRSETDYDEIWEKRTYDLAALQGVDIFLSYWGSPWITHTIASWEFEGGQHIAISIETRKEQGEEYSALLGFFRQFELHYVVADERDVIGIRTNHRGEDVYLYRLTAPVEYARALLLDYLEGINRLATKPKWYNAATHNCTTGIRLHAQNVAAGRPWDWRILVNGQIDQLFYERDTIDTSLPFDELRRLSGISARGAEAGHADDFSARIRAGLPGQRESAGDWL